MEPPEVSQRVAAQPSIYINILVPVSLGTLVLMLVVLAVVLVKYYHSRKRVLTRVPMHENMFYSGVSEKFFNIPFDAKWEFPRERYVGFN